MSEDAIKETLMWLTSEHANALGYRNISDYERDIRKAAKLAPTVFKRKQK